MLSPAWGPVEASALTFPSAFILDPSLHCFKGKHAAYVYMGREVTFEGVSRVLLEGKLKQTKTYGKLL